MLIDAVAPAGERVDRSANRTTSLDDMDGLLARLDARDDLLSIRVGGYCAWAIAKLPIKWLLIEQGLQFNLDGSAAAARTRTPDIESRWRARYALMRRVAPGALQLLANADAPLRGLPLALRHPRFVTCPDGRRRDAIFDDLLGVDHMGRRGIVMDYAWSGDTSTGARGVRGRLDAFPFLSLIGPWSRRGLRDTGEIHAAARAICDIVGDLDGALPGGSAPDLMAGWLRGFEATRQIFRGLFGLLRPSVVMLSNGGGHLGEIAAARDAGIPSVELQHGTYGPLDAGVHWPEAAIAHRRAIPVPDRMLVYGDMWRSALLDGGFWTERSVVAVGSAQVDRFRATALEPRARGGNGLRVLFPTAQLGVRETLEFWNRFLHLSAEGLSFPCELVLKLHPAEAHDAAAYRELEAAWPDRVEIVLPDESALQEILRCDLVAGHHSTCELEAIALGVPTVSLCTAMTPDGLAGMQRREWLADVAPHVRDPAALVELLAARGPSGSEAMMEWTRRTSSAGRDLFTPDFLAGASAAIAELVAGRRREPS